MAKEKSSSFFPWWSSSTIWLDSLIRTPFFELWLYGIRPCLSKQNHPHDVVGVTMWLERWAEGRNLSRWIYEIWMKYESGRESFIYNDGKVSGISDWSRFGTYVPIYAPFILSCSNSCKVVCKKTVTAQVQSSGVHSSRLESDEDWTVWRYWGLATGARIDSASVSFNKEVRIHKGLRTEETDTRCCRIINA